MPNKKRHRYSFDLLSLYRSPLKSDNPRIFMEDLSFDTRDTIRSAYEERLNLMHRAERIIKTSCSVKTAIIDGKGKRASQLRVRVMRPRDGNEDSFLSATFSSYRKHCNKIHFKSRGMFWEQHVKWTSRHPPEIEVLAESNVVYVSIISTFKQDIGVDDSRTIKHLQSILDSTDAIPIESRSLRARLKSLEIETDELRKQYNQSQRRVTQLESELQNVRERLVCRH
jgi:hypothetical protein